MARIPQRTFVSPRDSGAQLPQGSYNASIRATTGLIKAVGGIADFISKEGIKAQDIANDNQKRTKLREMREARAQFDIDMQGDPENGIPGHDPSTWGAKWKERLKGIEAGIMSGDMPPVVKRYVVESYKEFASRSAIEITSRSFKENRRIAKGTYLRDIQDAVQAGRYNDARAIVGEGDGVVFDPLDSRDIRKDIDKNEKQDTWDGLLRSNPREYQKMAEAGKIGKYKLTPHEQRQEVERAERETATQERDGVKAINDLIDIGEIKTEKDLEFELENSPEISRAAKERVLKNFRSKKPISFKERVALRDRMNDDFKAFKQGKISLDEYTKRHTQSGILMEGLGNRPGAGGLRQRLYQLNPDKFDPDGSGDENATRDRAKKFKDIDSVAEEIIRERVGAVGKVAAAKIDNNPVEKAKVTAREKERAIVLREAMEKKVRLWMNTLPEPPTAAEVKDYIDKIQAETVREVALRKKNPTMPKPVGKREKAQKWLNDPRYPSYDPNPPRGPGVLPPKP